MIDYDANMTALLDRPVSRQAKRLLTIADVDAMPRQLPTGPVDYELHNGMLTIMAPASGGHGRRLNRIATYLSIFGDLKGLGRAYTEAGLILSRDPDTLLVPDAMYVADQSIPVRESPEGYIENTPDIVVEVRSKNDTTNEIQKKVAMYHGGGVAIVWVIDPKKKCVTVYQRDESTKLLSLNDTLTAEGIIPDFKVLVSHLFPD